MSLEGTGPFSQSLSGWLRSLRRLIPDCHVLEYTEWIIKIIIKQNNYSWLLSKIHHSSDCSHKIKRYLLLGTKTKTNLDSILKSKDITLLTKIYMVKTMVFPVVMCRCESWIIIKKAEHQRSDAFKLWCWRRLLRVPWTAKRSNLVNPKGNHPWIVIGRNGAEAKAPILWPPDSKRQIIGKDLDSGKDWGQGEKWVTEDKMVGWYHQLNAHKFEQTPGDAEVREAWCAAVHGVAELDTI